MAAKKTPIRPADQIVNVQTETTLRMAEHERLLSFVNDGDAGWFDEWWHFAGRDKFTTYVNLQQQKGD